MHLTVLAIGVALQTAGMLALAPLLKVTIRKMKARLQNRQGPPWRQGYYDLAKLLRKEPVRSETASWIYVAGPRVYFAAAVAATTLVPVVVAAAPLEAAGGILLLVGTLALGRFALATAALDTGSPFGGMGASRDMTIADGSPPQCRWHITRVEGVRADGALPTTHVVLHSDAGAPGRLVVERAAGTPSCPTDATARRYPPCVLEMQPGDPLGAQAGSR